MTSYVCLLISPSLYLDNTVPGIYHVLASWKTTTTFKIQLKCVLLLALSSVFLVVALAILYCDELFSFAHLQNC